MWENSTEAQLVFDHHLYITKVLLDGLAGNMMAFLLLCQSSLWLNVEEGLLRLFLRDSWLMTSLHPISDAEEWYNAAHTKTRNATELCIHVLKRKWAYLQNSFPNWWKELFHYKCNAGTCVWENDYTYFPWLIQFHILHESPSSQNNPLHIRTFFNC